MIIKELDSFGGGDKFAVAGRKAEEQMAFYLRRAFAESSSVRVLNGVRLDRQGEVAQIDHLVLHSFGAVIVESKSVTTQVRINVQEEWARLVGRQWRGMRSPVLQATLQAELLKRYLVDHAELLLDKMVFGLIQTGFGAMALDVMVAISDQGQIKRQHAKQAPEVMKADQVPGRIRQRIKAYQRMTGPLNFSLADLRDAPRSFSERELTSIAAFLKNRHSPPNGVAAKPEPAPAMPSPPTPSPVTSPAAPVPANPTAAPDATSYSCRHCGSSQLTVTYGKYGYYFKCGDCQQNTPIKEACPQCGEKARIRKERERFFAECQACGTSRVFFTNPS